MESFYSREWNCLEKKLIVATAFMSGIIIGFIFAPIKKGVYCGQCQ